MKLKIGVIFGGETVEHEISVISAVQAMESIDRDKYEVVPIYISKDKTWYTGNMLTDIEIYRDMDLLKRYAKEVVLYKKGNRFILQNTKGFKSEVTDIDIAFPIVHGNNMEDGTIAGYLNLVGIPYVGSAILGSALGQDKVVLKQVLESSGINVVPYTWFYDNEYSLNKEEILKDIKKLGYPVIVKPASLGSSVGIKFVKSEKDLDSAVAEAISYDNKIIVEKAITSLLEVNCSVLGNYETQDTSEIEEVVSSDEILSYRDKYQGSGKSKGMVSARRIIPARITKKQRDTICEMSKQAFRVLNLEGVCRIDFLIDKDNGGIYVNELNTCPGSLSFYLWKPKGMEYSVLLDNMISLAIKRYKSKNSKVYSFDTNVLSNYNGTKGAKGKLGK
ncbi:MAG: D-alanine--D-alanine ligase [Bacilli bacterium]|nr:D-alanine--D-alanine ligase [Bacilli bacterium]